MARGDHDTYSRARIWRVVGLGALAVVVGALVVFSLTSRTPPAEARPRPTVTVTVTPTPTPTRTPTPTSAPVTISLLSDSHAAAPGSWWRQTVVAGMPRVTLGAFESQADATAEALLDRLDAATALGGLVLVQAGTEDLLSASDPEDALFGVQTLWDGVQERGADVVAVLVPPSNERPDETAELNRLIVDAAADRGIAVVDVYSPVANDDGTWIDGSSVDGVHASAEGSNPMADAARTQLTALLAGR